MIRLLFDENLSPRLVKLLADEFPGSVSVMDLGLDHESDQRVWEYAENHGYLLVCKDSDFYKLAMLTDGPGKFVRILLGNSPTQAVYVLLINKRELIEKFVTSDMRYLEIP